ATRRLLSCLTYAGRTPGGAPARWPALVDAATWDRVQARLANHRRQPHQASGRYLLTGLLRCHRCGGRMYGSEWRRRDGSTTRNYRCNAQVDPGCTYRANRPLIDGAVRDAVADLLALV